MKTFLIIDTYNFLHRAYHALPLTFRDVMGEPVNAVYGVSSMLINVLNKIHPQYMVSALDSHEPTFRVENFTAYKAHRKPMENDFATQIPKVIEILEAFGIKNVVLPGFEADDVIGTLVHKFHEEADLLVISNDRDLWQLTDKSVKIMVPNKTGDFTIINAKSAEEEFSFSPEKIPDYKGLRGDPSDNIPGVYGIGEKTAKKLITEFGSIENMYKNIEKVEPDSLRKKLLESYEQALMSKQLAKIVTDAPLTITLDECKYSDFNRSRVKTVLERYNFKSLVKRLGLEGSTTVKNGTPSVSTGQGSLF